VDGRGAGPYPVTGFGFSGDEPSYSVTRKLVSYIVSYDECDTDIRW
jgi:hypothetical protein